MIVHHSVARKVLTRRRIEERQAITWRVVDENLLVIFRL